MSIVSEILEIENNNNPSTEYVECELKKRGIEPLRWAIVKISKDFFTNSNVFEVILNLKNYIVKLGKSLDKSNYIVTVRGSGYKFEVQNEN